MMMVPHLPGGTGKRKYGFFMMMVPHLPGCTGKRKYGFFMMMVAPHLTRLY